MLLRRLIFHTLYIPQRSTPSIMIAGINTEYVAHLLSLIRNNMRLRRISRKQHRAYTLRSIGMIGSNLWNVCALTNVGDWVSRNVRHSISMRRSNLWQDMMHVHGLIYICNAYRAPIRCGRARKECVFLIYLRANSLVLMICRHVCVHSKWSIECVSVLFMSPFRSSQYITRTSSNLQQHRWSIYKKKNTIQANICVRHSIRTLSVWAFIPEPAYWMAPYCKIFFCTNQKFILAAPDRTNIRPNKHTSSSHIRNIYIVVATKGCENEKRWFRLFFTRVLPTWSQHVDQIPVASTHAMWISLRPKWTHFDARARKQRQRIYTCKHISIAIAFPFEVWGRSGLANANFRVLCERLLSIGSLLDEGWFANIFSQANRCGPSAFIRCGPRNAKRYPGVRKTPPHSRVLLGITAAHQVFFANPFHN